MYSSFSFVKSYCTFSIPLNPIKKTTQGPPTIYFLVFSLSSFLIDFFLSLHSVLSLLSIALFVLGWSKYARTFLNHQQKIFPINSTLQNLFFYFSQQPATTWNHQPPPRRDPRRGSLLRFVTTEATPWSKDHHAEKHGPPCRDDPNGLEAPPRWFLVVGCWLFRSPRWFHHAATIPTVWRRHHGGFWLLVVQISGGFWFRSPRQQLVFFCAKQQFGK